MMQCLWILEEAGVVGLGEVAEVDEVAANAVSRGGGVSRQLASERESVGTHLIKVSLERRSCWARAVL